MIDKNDHPKELVEEALQLLIPYARRIAKLCEAAVAERSVTGFHGALLQVTRSIQLLCGAIQNVKDTLQVSPEDPIIALERELQFILTRILEARNAQDDDLTRHVLRDELAPHLHSWSRVGLPALLRSRDC